MDITQLNGYNQVANEASYKSSKKAEVKKSKGNLFKRVLKKAEVNISALPVLTGDEQLAELMDDVFESGESLVKDPTMNNLRSYRSSLSIFLKFVVKNSLHFDSIEGRLNPKTFERKCYALISIVDKKVDDIARNVLGDQRKQFDILGAVEEINGLIIDLIS